jgi:SAM-dependent methyltransferase
MNILLRAARRLAVVASPRTTWGTDVRRIGDHVSFSERGFVAAQSPSDLLFRNYYEQAELRRILSGHPTARSLEIGCGFGRLSPVIAEFSSSHVAIDVNGEALDVARRHYPHVKFLRASATDLPFPSDYFDTVVSWTVLQHVPPHLISDAAKHLVRVARDGARIILLEATRFADRKPDPTAHTFDRSPETYAHLLAPLKLTESCWIEGIHRLQPYAPGQLMVFEK